MNVSILRRVAPVIGATCLTAGALTLVPQAAALADTPTAIAVFRPDDHPIPDRNGNGDASKKKSTRIYMDCDQVRAEGVGPLYRSDPRFNSFLDQNGDGIACNG